MSHKARLDPIFLGLWISQNEGSKFWLSVLTELKNGGVEDILIACVDGLKGFPDAIAAVYPPTKIQLCIVHMVRNSMKFVVWKDYKEVFAYLKLIYQANTEDKALAELEKFAAKWDAKYSQISKSWRANWANLRNFFEYPMDIRKVIYMTNAIEYLNSIIRAAKKRRMLFPNNDSAMKVVYLANSQAAKKWTMTIHNWRLTLNRFTIKFSERVEKHIH